MKIFLKPRRNYGFIGPMYLSTLPENIKNMFRINFEFQWYEYFTDGTECNSQYQVPNIFWPEMIRYNEKWLSIWSNKLIEIGLNALKENNVDLLSPEDYPKAALQIYDALNLVDIKGKNVAVLGTISPWIEVICLYLEAKNVYSIDYNKPLIEHQDDDKKRIKAIEMKDINNCDKFDIVVSFSSIEHDGLGRFGDPINPHGDIDAINEVYEMLVDDGVFICGIPIGETNKVVSNWHRIFSKSYIDILFNNFERIKDIPYPYGQTELCYDGDDWKNQPVFILKKK